MLEYINKKEGKLMTYKRILLTVDGSAHSIRATEHAVKLTSNQSEAVVEILYVLHYDRTRSDVIDNATLEDLHPDRQERLHPIISLLKQQQIQYVLTIKHGDPGPTIVQYANEHSVDIVIIGSRGLNRLQEMVLGSVSHKVAKRVNAPVLIIK